MSSAARTSPRLAASFARLALFVIVSLLAGVIVAGAALPFVGGVGVIARVRDQELRVAALAADHPPLPQRSRILAADGTVLATLYEQNRIEVPLTSIPP